MTLAGFDGFIVPRTDAYQNEEILPSDERVAFLSGFTGSAATIVVLKGKAAFFTDGRYTLQAMRQVSPGLFESFDSSKKTPLSWLEENASKGMRIAYDPWLHTAESAERLKVCLAKIGASAVPVVRNLVDLVWKERPQPPAAPVYQYGAEYAGKTSADKRMELAALMRKKAIAAAVISDPASVAWLFNIRGNDVPYTPSPLSRAILNADGTAEWFVEPQKVTKELPAHLGESVNVLPPEEMPTFLEALARTGKRILIDPAVTPSWIADCLTAAQGKVEYGEDPCALPRAIKNAVELKGMRAAQERDSAAIAGFLAWLDAHWKDGGLTELGAAADLQDFRKKGALYRGPSFESISAVGAHGAIVHYRATKENDAPMAEGGLYLIDSGGQYLDGTTDVTRTVVLGVPSVDMRKNFTRVLKGHIALAAIVFPEGTTGADLDVLARQHLWAAGLDYNHGTGHGVGCYLSGHEGPQGISKRNKTPLRPGMILSNEPGYYKEGAYGIRIESLQAVVETPEIEGGENKTFGFDVLTLVPIDRKLVDISMLTESERVWLNAYHRRVREALKPKVDAVTAAWLEAATGDM